MLNNKQLSISTYVEFTLAFTRNRNSLEAVGILQEVQDVLREVIRGFFKKYDYFDDMAIDIYDFPLLLRDMGEKVDVNVIREYIREQQRHQQSEQGERSERSEQSSYRSSPQTATLSPNQTLSPSISLSFEDCYYSLLSSVGSSDQDIKTIIRDILHTHSISNLPYQSSLLYRSVPKNSTQSKNQYTTTKVTANDNEDENNHIHTPNQQFPSFSSTYASQLKYGQSRHSFNDVVYSNDAEGYYDDETRFHWIPYQEEDGVFQDIPSNHSLSQSSHSNHSQNQQPQKEVSKHNVLKVRTMLNELYFPIHPSIHSFILPFILFTYSSSSKFTSFSSDLCFYAQLSVCLLSMHSVKSVSFHITPLSTLSTHSFPFFSQPFHFLYH